MCGHTYIHDTVSFCYCTVYTLVLRKFPDVCLSRCFRAKVSKINDIFASRKRFPASSLPYDGAKCAKGPRKDESSAYDGGGIVSTPAPHPRVSSTLRLPALVDMPALNEPVVVVFAVAHVW